MKKSKLILGVFLTFILASGLAFAGEAISDPKIIQNYSIKVSGHDTPCEKAMIKRIAYQSLNPDLPFLLQVNQQACLDQCSQAYDSCMNGAGDNASAKFRCGEKRRMCTLGCDNKWYSKMQF